MGIGFSFSEIGEKDIDKILKSRWSGTNYEKRIWNNTQALAKELKSEMLAGFMTGKTNREMAKVIQEKFGVKAYEARRLVRTESCYVANMTEMLGYAECGIEQYEYNATLDTRTSEICQRLDGKVFNVKDAQPGINMPPMHPNCRSTTTAYFGEEIQENMARRVRNPETGESEVLPNNIKYEEWKERYVGKKKDVENSAKNDIINNNDTAKEVIEVHTVGKIDREIFKCITEDIVTDEVIITDERIQHIKLHHPNDYERFSNFFEDIIKEPDYIVEANRINTALILKKIDINGEKFKMALRLITPKDDTKYKNSIITFMKIDNKEWERLLKNKRILYKKE